MIAKQFNNGWGPEFELKRFEDQLLEQLYPLRHERVAVVNSVWYNKEFHQKVLAEIAQGEFDRVAVSAMLDFSIPQPDWFEDVDVPVDFVGYYPGKMFVDYWALFIDHYFADYSQIELINSTNINHAFMCLNRKPHWHRKKLFSQLQSLDLVENQLVSMGTDTGEAVATLPDDHAQSDLAPNGGTEQNGIGNDIASLGNLRNWQNHLLFVVTETVWDINHHYFVSEKIYKPIVGFRPFLVYAPDGGVQWLRDRKFEPYVDDFTDICDADLSTGANIPGLLRILANQPRSYWQNKYKSLREKILYNHNNFANYIKQQKFFLERRSNNVF